VTPHAVRPAIADDIPELVRLRDLMFEGLAGTWGQAPAGDQWRHACATALAATLTDDSMRLLVTGSGTGLARCGAAAIDQRLPSPFNPGGRTGHIFGIVTDPAHRRRGRARAVMMALLDWLDQQRVRVTDLNASPDGQQLYRSLGFTSHPDPALRPTRPAG